VLAIDWADPHPAIDLREMNHIHLSIHHSRTATYEAVRQETLFTLLLGKDVLYPFVVE
jgi:hypothetical protein